MSHNPMIIYSGYVERLIKVVVHMSYNSMIHILMIYAGYVKYLENVMRFFSNSKGFV